MPDPFVSNTPSLTSPAANAFSIVPSNDNDLSQYIRALYVGGAGNVNVDTVGGQTVVFSGLTAGSILPVRIKRVRSTSTTATGLVGLY